MARAVLDTNVLVSAFIRPAGPPGRLLVELATREAFELVLSESIVDELRRALRYPAVRKRLLLSDDELDTLVAMLEILSTVVDPSGAVAGGSRDPSDDHILAAAVEGCAEYIVSGDDDLLSMAELEGIRIVTPRQFLELIAR